MKNKNILLAIIINIFITVFEIALGIISGSMALISDAVHNFSDVGAMSLAWWGEKVAGRAVDSKKTFGYKRAEILIALANSTILFGIVIFILVESIKRLGQPQEIEGMNILLTALVALIGNSVATYLLNKDSHRNLNLKSASLHSLQDSLFSLGVVIGAILIQFTGWTIIDPLISIFLSLYILKEVYGIIKQTANILMEAVPEDIDADLVRKEILALDNVTKISDLHIWQSDSKNRLLSAHVETEELNSSERFRVLNSIQELLCTKFEITHSTIQLVSKSDATEALNCQHCN